jgi:hypothetical protein
MAGTHLANDLERGIVPGVSAKKNLEAGVILPKEAFDIFPQARLESVDGLDQRYRRQLRIERSRLPPPARVGMKLAYAQ